MSDQRELTFGGGVNVSTGPADPQGRLVGLAVWGREHVSVKLTQEELAWLIEQLESRRAKK